MRVHQHERGFALIGAVFALVVIATLVAGAFFASMQEDIIGRSTQTFQRAFDAAEAGMATRIVAWPTTSVTLNGLSVGDSATYVDTLPDGKSTVTSYVRRLNTQLFLIRTLGGSGTSSRMLGAIAKLQLANLNIQASLTTRSSLSIGGSSFIDGRNTNPTGWGCDAVSNELAGVRTADSNLITTSGGGHSGLAAFIAGTPLIQQDTTVKDSIFTNFGGLTYWDLAAMASITFNGNVPNSFKPAPVGDATTCDGSNIGNWGEPWRTGGYIVGCINYFPIIHVAGTVTVVNGVTTVTNGTGNLSLSGGRGQGILLVDGDVDVTGGFEFYGPVIAMGHFTSHGTGGHFNGGVMAADVNLELNTVLGNALVTYSSCTILRALTASANARLIKERRWMDLTQ
jgi:hypothetical protein